MKKSKAIILIIGTLILVLTGGNVSGRDNPSGSMTQQTTTKSQQTTTKSQQTTTKTQSTTSKSGQTKSKSQQTTSKSTQTKSKSQPAAAKPAEQKKPSVPETVTIGSQAWALANLSVGTFRNGDTIPEAKSNEEWSKAGEKGQPAWCYYNNDPAMGKKYGRLYNWFAVNDPRGLAPAGWILPSDADWAKLSGFLGGQKVAGTRIKSTSGWKDGYNGTNDTGFNGLPGGYRIENGSFLNLGSNAVWWSTTEDNTLSAFDRYLVLFDNLDRSNTPKQRGSSVRCLKE
jgi:uncharacterized protein (TIGR02145 family)